MIHKPNYIDAIVKIYPEAKCLYQNEDLSTLVWEDGNPNNITEEQIIEKHSELMIEYNNTEYQRKRKIEYPSLEDCIHAILDDDLDNLQALRQAVKDKYPKWVI